MLEQLSIRDLVVIEQVDIEFAAGLNVLTGETGAGKSILLDALGLALGRRGDAGLVRTGADRASVTARFGITRRHPAGPVLAAHDLLDETAAGNGAELILRRVVSADGRSRAFINDRPATVGLLAEIGEALLEIHGQHDRIGLLDPATHRATLDSFAKADDLAATCAEAHRLWRERRNAQESARADAAAAERDAVALRDALDELQALDPKPGEDAVLAEQRAMLQDSDAIRHALAEAADLLGGEHPVDEALGRARRRLAEAGRRVGGRLDDVLGALDRAAIEVGEAVAALDRTGHDLNRDPGQLEAVESRLFALRAAARRHGVAPDSLNVVAEDLEARLNRVMSIDDHLNALAEAVRAARADFATAAGALSRARAKAAKRLDRAVNAEMAGLKMEKARFTTRLEALNDTDWSQHGAERIRFEVATNPGAAPGPLHKIASGGELSRFMLALKVALAGAHGTGTLVFDEVDAGIGGATADAVGARLARLGRDHQVLVVTHQPQVAGRADHHFRVSKSLADDRSLTRVELLDDTRRREEIARMLAGAEVTDEARAAADRLITTAPRP